MTYALELFIAMILGLSLGHFLFNVHAPVVESATACCAGRNAAVSDIQAPSSPRRLRIPLAEAGFAPGDEERVVRGVEQVAIPGEGGRITNVWEVGC